MDILLLNPFVPVLSVDQTETNWQVFKSFIFFISEITCSLPVPLEKAVSYRFYVCKDNSHERVIEAIRLITSLVNLSFEFISLILRNFSLSSSAFYLENGRATILCDKKPENLSEISYENKQNKLKTQVSYYRFYYLLEASLEHKYLKIMLMVKFAHRTILILP